MKRFFLHFYIVTLLLLLINNFSIGQTWNKELYFRNISTEEGLSNPTINCITQDSRGYIWLGTVDGLNRYDGYEFKIYRNILNDTNSICSNRINALYEDEHYNIWIGTSAGLSQFNYKTEKFTNYANQDDIEQVFDIAHDQINNRIWIVSSRGKLKYLDLESGLIRTHEEKVFSDAVMYKILIVEGNLFLGTANRGMYQMSLDSFIVEEFCNTHSGRFQIPGKWITAIHYFEKQLFIGTDEGLIVYDFINGNSNFYNPLNSEIPSKSVYAIDHDSSGELYIGTAQGMAIFNSQSLSFSSHFNTEGMSTSLSANLIRSIFVDNRDNLWVGTVQKGIDILNKRSRSVTLVEKKLGKQNTISGNSISAFVQDNKGGIWIGTKENGLNYYLNGRYQLYDAFDSKDGISNYNVTDLTIDDNEVVWISVYNSGLYAYRNSGFMHFQKDVSNPLALQSNKIRSIFSGKNGILWMASEDGLLSYDTEKKIFLQHTIRDDVTGHILRKNIRKVYQDSRGDVYAGTNSGLYIYHPETERTEHFQADPNDSNALGHNTIIEIFEDSQNRIWLGSFGGGLILFDKEGQVFKNYAKQNNFPDNSVKSIEEDSDGNLWIGSNNGILKFSPDTEQTVRYGKSYGLQSNVFNINASLNCIDGRMIFGGPDGFNVLRPEELDSDLTPLKIIITDLKIFDKSVGVLDEHDILSKNISLEESLCISYQQSKHFSVSFSALDFSNPEKVQYAYKLDGFEDDWYIIGNKNNVSFTNLAPNDYVLNIMASDNGIWNNKVKQLKISIHPPYYMRLWFKLAVVLLIILVVFSFYFYKRYQFRMRQKELEILVNEKNKEISSQNEELQAINEELVSQNEAVVKQRDFIDDQNIQLTKVQDELKMANLTLEEKIKIRTKELVESNRTLDKAVKELDRFVYSASHDLTAPLKSVLGLVNIAKLDDKGGNLNVHLNYIEDSIIKQENVIKNLIQYSRNARQAVKPESINLFNLVNQVIVDLRYLPGSDRVNMINNLAEGEVIVTDDQRMKMVINNLLSNGIKYQDRNKNDSFVKIDLTKDTNSWRLMVEDNGQGIAEDQQRKIFDMFHRANEQSEGSGLGLFIVMEAVERLGGMISVKSSLNKGSVFELEFPFL